MLESDLSRTCRRGLARALRCSLDFQTRLFFRQLPNPQNALQSFCHEVAFLPDQICNASIWLKVCSKEGRSSGFCSRKARSF